MQINELKELVSRTEKQGLGRIILVIVRKSAPSGWKIRVKGMGLGQIANIQEKNGLVETVAWFNIKDVKRYIGLYESAQSDAKEGK